MRPGDDDWLEAELGRLLSFGTSARPGEWLDDDGNGEPGRDRETWLAARSLHVRSLGALAGVPGSLPLAQAALTALAGPLHDAEHGGWHARLAPDGTPVRTDKGCYEHAFVLLAAGTAVRAGLADAVALRSAAETVLEEKFWDDNAGMCLDSWSPDWSTPASYRGLNGNMHAVEAMLATGGRWTERAHRICARVVDTAGTFDCRLPEHYDEHWRPEPEAGRERPDDPFKPYGATVGHGLEWSRLLLDLEAAVGATAVPAELVATARGLYATAVRDGWAADGEPGFVYTTDWSGRPIVRERMHWVVAEAIAAAATLHRRTGESAYADDYHRWWDYADRYVLDHVRGSWHHELDPANQPSRVVWSGKPDLYHAVQATLIPRYPVSASVADAVLAGRPGEGSDT
jgi:sulfoquinovose isomerase